MFNTSSSALSDRRSLCLVTEYVPSAELGRQLFFSVNFYSFPRLLRRWHLHQISGIPST